MDFQLVWFERKGGLALGAIKRAGPTKVQLIDPKGKLQRIPRARLLDTLGASFEAKNHEAAGREVSARLAAWGAAPAEFDEQELHAQLEPGRSYSLGELAEATLGARDDEAISRLALGLLGPKGRLLDCVRVERGAVIRQSSEVFAELRERRAARAAREQRLATVRSWWESGAAPAPELAPLIEELVDYALRGHPDASRELRAIAKELGGATPDALLAALETRGLLPRHTNEVPERAGLALGFPPDVEAEAETPLPEEPPQLDLRERVTLAIDPPGSHEADDALSLWEEDGATWIAIHVARPRWTRGGPLDQAARERASTAYFDDRVLPLLPPALVGRYSLDVGEERPALSYVARVTPDGLSEGRFLETRIRVDHAWTYTEAEGHAELEPWIAIAEQLRAARFERGARNLERARVRFSLDAERRVQRSVDARASAASRVVGECMVHYNHQAARALVAASLRAPFRGQPQSTGPAPVQVTPEPLPHGGLGVEAYVQASSPLRRYGDWVAQQQLLAALERGPALAPVTVGELCEQLPKRERKVRQAEEERQRYLLTSWLAEHPAPLHGWLVSASPGRWRVQVDELGREQTVRPPRWSAEPGAKLVLEALDVEPRARTFRLRALEAHSAG